MTPVEPRTPRNDRIYFCAPVNALVEGIYQQRIPFTENKRHGGLVREFMVWANIWGAPSPLSTGLSR